MLTGFGKPIDKSKVVRDSHTGNDNGALKPAGGKTNVPFRSVTKGVWNPTTDSDDYGMKGTGLSTGYGTSNKGGASGDGATPGFVGSGAGISQLDGAQNNKALRKIAY